MTGGSGTTLLDTNILVYAYDRSDMAKQQRAVEVLDSLASRRAGAITTQVLAEFFSTIIRKPADPLPVEAAEKEVARHLRTWNVLDLTAAIVLEAIRGVRDHRLNYWDAQIWAVARLNQISVVLSEDFSDGSILEGVRFLNPIRPAFPVADWI